MLPTAVQTFFLLACKLLSTHMTIPLWGIPVLLARMLVVLFLVDKQAPVLLQKLAFGTVGALFFGLLLFGLVAADWRLASCTSLHMFL